MRSKKILSIAIAATVILSTTSSVFATADEKMMVMQAAGELQSTVDPAAEKQAKITKDEAKGIAKAKLKEYLGLEMEESKFQIRIDFRPSYYAKDEYIWDINWNSNDVLKNTNIRVSLNANTGKVISMGKYVYSQIEPQPTVPSITREKAKELTEAFMSKAFTANELAELKLMDDSMINYINGGYQSVNYSFNYQRYKNGVLLEGDFVRVEVDGVNGTLIGFDSRLSENINLPSLEGVVSKEKAEEVFKNETELSLLYLAYRDKYDYELKNNTIKLVYNIGENSYKMVDAKTGTVVKDYYQAGYEEEIKDLTPDERAEWLKKAQEVKSAAAEITSDRAEKVMIEKLKELYGETYKIEYLSYEENNQSSDLGGRKAWRANFYKEVDGKRTEEGGSITIDALTEGILSMYKYDNAYRYDEEFTPKLTWTESYNKAVETIAKYFPDKIKNVKTEQKNIKYKQIVNGKEIPQREYYFNFQRVENNILYRNDVLSVLFDAETGAIREMRCTWNDKLTFPSASGAMSNVEAESVFFEKYKPELTYVLIQTPAADGKVNQEYKLAYRLKPVTATYTGEFMDAFNGKFVNYDGQEVVDQSSEFFKKIKGHKLEKELTILAFQGIIDTNTFELDKSVTALDFARMLVDAKGYRPYLLKEAAALKASNVAADNPNYKYLQMAVYYGILENKEGEFDFNKKVSREDMAKVIVKILGYDKLAKATDIFMLPVLDRYEVNEGDTGYVAIAKALGILEVENNLIRPNADATMVELAEAIYNVLGSLRGNVIYY